MANEPIIAGLCAAAEIVSDHWTQGELAREFGGEAVPVDCGTRFCLEGVLILVFADEYNRATPEFMQARLATEYALYRDLGVQQQPLWQWNDASGRTADEVVSLLLQTAKNVREHGEGAD